MTALFVHGNPETSAVWEPLVEALAARGATDVRLTSPPGFGAPIPGGFGCTHAEYRDWLIDEAERAVRATGAPVDLVGHDWGAGHVYAVAAARPDLLRSWAADCAGLLHPDYEWHAAAQAWQTAGLGERRVAARLGAAPETVVAWGVPPGLAPSLAGGIDEAMNTATLALYRSAPQPVLRDLGAALSAAERRPALVIEPTADPFVSAELGRAYAASLGAEVLRLDGAGHWWMWEFPDAAADALVRLWGSAAHVAR